MLPRNLKYGNRVESAQAKSYLSNIQPNGALGGYKPNSVTTLMIPTGPNLAMVCGESLLKFSPTIIDSAGATGRLESCGGHAFISKIKVYHGTNVLEEIENYNLYAKEMFDLQVSTDAVYGKHSIMTGTRSDMYTNSVAAIASTASVTAGDAPGLTLLNEIRNKLIAISDGLKTKAVNSGATLKGWADVGAFQTALTASPPTATKTTYAITLISLLGSLCSSVYLPLFALTSGPLRLEITWASGPTSIGAFPSTSTDFIIDEVEYIGSYLQLSDTAMGSISSSLSGPLSFSVQGVKNSNFTYKLEEGSQSQVNFLINAKYGSVKSVLCATRSVDAISKPLHFPLSCCRFNLNSYSFKLGSSSCVPSIPPSSISQMFAEVLKTVSSISDVNHQPSIDIESYSQNVPEVNTAGKITAGSVNSGSFYIGLDCENYAESDKSTIYTGYDGSKSDMYCVMNFGPQTAINGQPAGGVNARFDAFIIYDKEIIFQNNTCYVQE